MILLLLALIQTSPYVQINPAATSIKRVCQGDPRCSPTMPDATLTPGDTVPVTVEQVCRPGYAKSVRNVPESEKAEVFRRYGIDRTWDKFEVDHLISLELGGSNAVTNLWPESYTPRQYNAHTKDALENRLHWLVCHGQITLATAQQAIARDWIAAFRYYVQQNRGLR